MRKIIVIAISLLLALATAGAQQQANSGMFPSQGMQGDGQQSPAANGEMPLSPKRADVVRIGVAFPEIQLGQGNTGFDPSEAIRNSIMQYLQGPLVEAVPLSSRIEMQLQAEAKQKDCDYVFYSSVAQKKGGGMFGKLGSVGSIASNVVPMAGSISSTGAVAAGIAVNAAATASSVASGFKNKDEITFQFKVATPDNSQLAAKTSKVKAKQDGDDVLSPQIQEAASITLEGITKSKKQ